VRLVRRVLPGMLRPVHAPLRLRLRRRVHLRTRRQ
jgi:hypothetical protein